MRSPGDSVSAAVEDETSSEILRHLAGDGRLTFSQLARRVHLSTPATIARVRKLEAAKVIRGYRADINPEALGLPIEIYVLMVCTRSGERRLREDLPRFPEITDCRLLLGDMSFIIRASLASVEHSRDFLERLGTYGETRSGTVLESLELPSLPARDRR
jgi:Lrp/AsnC family transcriptional regulator, leucine-responsive regulatory protein